MPRQIRHRLGCKEWYHRCLNMSVYRCLRSCKLHLIQETPLKGGIQDLGHVCGGNLDSFHLLHLLQYDDLKGIVYFIHRPFCHFCPRTPKMPSASLKSRMGGNFAMLYQPLIISENGANRFFALSNPLTLQFAEVNLQYIPPIFLVSW